MIQARKAHIHSWAKWVPEGMKWKIRKYEINMNKQTAYIKGRFICTNARKEDKDILFDLQFNDKAICQNLYKNIVRHILIQMENTSI